MELSPDQLLEQIVEEFTARLRQGERPAIQEYVERHPELREEIDELLSSAAMIEELKASRSSDPPRRDLSELTGLKSIGDYDLVRELGRGGMGVVFEGIHRSLRRQVAIKIVPRHLVENPDYLTRFEREAQAAASLHHTNIVSVFGVGNSEGHCYYVMEYIAGENLSNVIWDISHGRNQFDTEKHSAGQTVALQDKAGDAQERRDNQQTQTATRIAHPATEILHEPVEFTVTATDSSPRPNHGLGSQLRALRDNPVERQRWAARLAMQVADALAYAHQQGILHRDVKPSNLILDSNQRVWVTDFGLVKNLTDQSLTKTGDIVGTIQYMPPEAFEGKYDVRSETYSLGLTLYELVNLQPAFANTSTPELIRQIVSNTHRIKPLGNLPRDLQTIISKSISREPAHRYASAKEFRDDLRAFLEDRPIQARRPGSLEILQKWAKRNPLVAGLASAIALLLIAVAVVSLVSYRQLNVAYQDVLKQKEKTREEFVRAETNLQLTMEAFDTLYANILYGENSSNQTIVDGLQEISGIRTVVTEKDAGLLKSMLAFYERFAKENENSEKLERQTTRALRRVANIYRLLGEVDESIAYYESAIQKLEANLSEDEQPVQQIIDFVRVNNEYALALQQKGLNTQFRKRFEKSQSILENSPELESNQALQLELARTFNLMGTNATMFAAAGSTRSPRDGLWQLALRRDRRNPRMGNPSPRMGNPNPRLGNQNRRRFPGRRKIMDSFEERMSRWNELGFNNKAAEILENLQKKDPKNPEIRLELAKCYTLLASRPDADNRSYLSDSIKILEQLLEEDPDNSDIKYHLALCCVIPNSQATTNGRQLLETADSLISEMKERYPLNLEYQQVGVIVHAKKADNYIHSGDLDDALTELKLTESLLRKLTAETPSANRLAPLYLMLANLNLNLALEFRWDGNRVASENALRRAQRLHPAGRNRSFGDSR